LSEFNAAGVRYLLVGGHAMAVHAIPRATKDLDLWIDATPANAKRVYAALARFGAALDAIDVDDFAAEGKQAVGRPQDLVDVELLRRAR
jgi:hypothetical protein